MNLHYSSNFLRINTARPDSKNEKLKTVLCHKSQLFLDALETEIMITYNQTPPNKTHILILYTPKSKSHSHHG
jgi:hypothetical protein